MSRRGRSSISKPDDPTTSSGTGMYESYPVTGGAGGAGGAAQNYPFMPAGGTGMMHQLLNPLDHMFESQNADPPVVFSRK